MQSENLDGRYTINLEIRVAGPDRPWRSVAKLVAGRLHSLNLGNGFYIQTAALDTADPEDE